MVAGQGDDDHWLVAGTCDDGLRIIGHDVVEHRGVLDAEISETECFHGCLRLPIPLVKRTSLQPFKWMFIACHLLFVPGH